MIDAGDANRTTQEENEIRRGDDPGQRSRWCGLDDRPRVMDDIYEADFVTIC